MNFGLLLIRGLVAIFILFCVPPCLAQSSQGIRWDHDVARAFDEPVNLVNVKVSIDALKMRNNVGCRTYGIDTSVHDDSLVNPKAVVSRAEAAAWAGQSTSEFNMSQRLYQNPQRLLETLADLRPSIRKML